MIGDDLRLITSSIDAEDIARLIRFIELWNQLSILRVIEEALASAKRSCIDVKSLLDAIEKAVIEAESGVIALLAQDSVTGTLYDELRRISRGAK